MKRALPLIVLLSLCVFFGFRERENENNVTFDDPIDAISVGSISSDVDLRVSAFIDGTWTTPTSFTLENEQDPGLHESNLIMFPKKTRKIRFEGKTKNYVIHPIRISDEPVHYQIAARTPVGTPKILKRNEWGADDTYLFAGTTSQHSSIDTQGQVNETATGPVSQRISDCEEAQKKYPQEFKAQTTISSKDGKVYRWPLQYSKDIKFLVVHHTAIANGDGRSGAERMRALYSYHANNKGWGDIGYHYVIDDTGQIFEGKAGGKYVVGGHAYCNNLGTIGVALMGNFDTQEPTQEQLKALQWLLADVGDIYGIDPARAVTFHGERFQSPIVGHRDLLSTDCPGYYVFGSLDQIRNHVISGDTSATVKLPDPPRSSSSRTRVIIKEPPATPGLTVAGSLDLSSNPLGKQRITLHYTIPSEGLPARGKVATVSRSDNRIGIWHEFGGEPQRVTSGLILGKKLNGGTTISIPLLIQAPETEGTYRFDVGTYRFMLTVRGRRARTTILSSSSSSKSSVRSVSSSISSRSSSAVSSPRTQSSTIRIKLAFAGSNPSLVLSGKRTGITRDGSSCSVALPSPMKGAVLRFSEEEFGTVGVSNGTETRTYHGTVECRIIDGSIVLINELHLDDYMEGVAEEPDTEPYEKQRAFAIAARTYALFYIQATGSNRKFPNLPYDGSDDPAIFQLYKGIEYARKHPHWIQAVHSTQNQVLMKNNTIIKPPYFSSDDGRTRTPAEAGWKTFPFAEIFTSKPDPWCNGMTLRGHGVGMSGCGAEGQANEGKTGEEILKYYYPGTELQFL